VLLVEDNPVNLMVGQRLLGVLGIQCDTAGNGEAALMRMSASRYDLVLMDCQMPVMDGYTATRRWREDEHAKGDGNHLPIIAMTANAMAGDRQKCLDAGMDDYLAKPVTRAELERCVARWWTPRAGAREPLDEDAVSIAGPPIPSPVTPAAAVPIVLESILIKTPIQPSSQRPVQASPPVTTFEHATVPALIDRDVLDELRAVLGDEADRLVDVFLDDTPSLLAKLEAAALAPDFTALREAAHSLKSSSANLGALALSNAAKRVELGARMQTLDRPAVAVAMVVEEFNRARARLLALREEAAAVGH